MLIKLHGIFATDYGPEYTIEADTVGEAIDGLARQLRFYEDRPIELRPVARAVGFNTVEELFTKTEQTIIHLVPAMIGGGGGVGKIILGGLAIAAAFIPGIGPAISSALISIGATLVLSGAMQLFMKAPSSKGSADPEASQYMGLSDNTVEIGTPIPIQYGRGPATGHVLAVNVDSSDLVIGNFPVTTS